MLEIRDLSVRYGQKTIVDRLSFSVQEGQWLMIVGPNGAGKSTALEAVTQAAPYTGSVLLDGQDVRRMKHTERARRMGVLMQKNFVGYSFTVEEVVRLGRFAYSAGLFGRQQTDDRAMAERALQNFEAALRGERVQNVLHGEQMLLVRLPLEQFL